MSTKLFLDTNFFLDAAMKERPGWEYALMLMDEFAYGKASGYLAASSLKDIYYVLSKYAGESSARSYIADICEVFTLIAVDEVICKSAVVSNEPDFEDGLIRACAESVPVDFIISRDEKAFAKSPLKRFSAQEYVELFCPFEEVADLTEFDSGSLR